MTDEANSPDRYDRILRTVGGAFDSLGTWPDHPRALEHLADAVEQLLDIETEASSRRTVTFVERIDAARAWARRNLAPDQLSALFGHLRGDEPEQPVHHALDHVHHGDAHTPPYARCICGHADDGAGAIDAHIGDTNQEPNPCPTITTLEPPKETPDA